MSLTIAADTASDQVRHDALVRHGSFSVAQVMQTTGVSERTVEETLAKLVQIEHLYSYFSVRCPATGDQLEAHSDIADVPYAHMLTDRNGGRFLVGPTDVIVLYTSNAAAARYAA